MCVFERKMKKNEEKKNSVETPSRLANRNFNRTGAIFSYFLRLISLFISQGFLLGRFVAEREQKIKEIQMDEQLGLIRELQNAHTLVVKTYHYKLDNDTDFDVKYKNDIFNQLINCTSTKTNDMKDLRLEKLIDTSLHLLINCYNELENYIKQLNSGK